MSLIRGGKSADTAHLNMNGRGHNQTKKLYCKQKTYWCLLECIISWLEYMVAWLECNGCLARRFGCLARRFGCLARRFVCLARRFCLPGQMVWLPGQKRDKWKWDQSSPFPSPCLKENETVLYCNIKNQPSSSCSKTFIKDCCKIQYRALNYSMLPDGSVSLEIILVLVQF